MRNTGLTLVATVDNGTASHPITSPDHALSVWNLLSPFLPGAEWHVEETS